ncbi:UDP-glucose 4-epimerase GalE [Virgibacillus phasianinus]|uniref:UDP-glucose 4-epimerase n=1 Tax=Virgibacillus phasianinus TaxID=2017483 RepID=A0A220U5Y5_9BACI|nr:UDP-glucose 4-epimerase GalE [Virgibacillus phasianinus]ASK63724.1 UDP-glucose 4-epimerase GalE [Virgibacillus phasianinus]
MMILVTGGAGYIGSHTCVELLNAGHEIVVLDNFSNSHPEALRRVSEITGKQFTIYHADLLNKEKLNEVFAKNKFDAVIHLAGLKAVGESVTVPLRYYENNITGTIYLVAMMKKYQVRRLVFSSSATVYGMTNKMPITEDTPLSAVNPYGRTKQMIETLLHDVYQADKTWNIALLRYFNPVGAHESGLIGENPNGIPNNLMPYISQVAIGKLKKLTVFGNDYPTKDGTGLRDYLHVVDLAKGHVKALEKDENGIDAYNLGTGTGYSVLEMIAAFEKASGQNIPFTVSNRRAGDAAVCYANPVKAGIVLGWQASRGIVEMCEDTWRWQRNNPSGYEEAAKNRDGTPMLNYATGFLMPE